MNGHWRLLLRGLTDGGKSHPRMSLIRCLGGARPAPGVAVGAADGAGAPWRRGPHSTASSWGKAPRELDRPRKARAGLYVDACACARHTERRARIRTFQTPLSRVHMFCAHVQYTRMCYTCGHSLHTHTCVHTAHHTCTYRIGYACTRITCYVCRYNMQTTMHLMCTDTVMCLCPCVRECPCVRHQHPRQDTGRWLREEHGGAA